MRNLKVFSNENFDFNQLILFCVSVTESTFFRRFMDRHQSMSLIGNGSFDNSTFVGRSSESPLVKTDDNTDDFVVADDPTDEGSRDSGKCFGHFIFEFHRFGAIFNISLIFCYHFM